MLFELGLIPMSSVFGVFLFICLMGTSALFACICVSVPGGGC